MSDAPPNKPTNSPPLSPDLAAPAPRPTIPCPKCGTPVRDIARFCPRCHSTLRFQCPACAHEQRHGGICEECGVDFLKYISSIMAAKQAEADQYHEMIDRRSSLLKNVLLAPFNLGIPLIRSFFAPPPRPHK
jgi:hypothetical protein